jgi:hypothetical protein
MLKAEKCALFPDDPHEWTGFESVPLVAFEPQFYTPAAAAANFLDQLKPFIGGESCPT